MFEHLINPEIPATANYVPLEILSKKGPRIQNDQDKDVIFER